MDIRFVDITDTFVNQAYLDILLTNFRQRMFDRFSRSLNIAFQHNIQFLHLALLHLHVEGIKADLPKRSCLAAALFYDLSSHLLCRTLIVNNFEAIACLWYFGQTQDTDRCAGRSLLNTLAAVI